MAVGTSLLVTLAKAARPNTGMYPIISFDEHFRLEMDHYGIFPCCSHSSDVGVLGRTPGTVIYRDIRQHRNALTVPGVIIFRFDGQV